MVSSRCDIAAFLLSCFRFVVALSRLAISVGCSVISVVDDALRQVESVCWLPGMGTSFVDFGVVLTRFG